MSCRRASTSDALACSNLLASDATSLHEKLHSVEAARTKELQAHGQLVQQLQSQLTSQCQTAKELQLAVAKLRAEKCRLEAEAGSSLAKLRAVEEKANDAEQQHERWAEDYRQRLLTKDEELTRLLRTIEELKREKNEAAVVNAERTSHVGSMKRETERITAERDDARLALAASTQDVAQLATRLAVKQAELDAERKKTEQMHRELETQTKQLADQESRIRALTRACERLETTRFRVAAWGRVRVGIMERDVRFRDVFLEWKAQTLLTKTTHNRKMRLEAQQRLDQLVRVRSDLHGKFRTTRAALEAAKVWLQHQRDDMRAWEEICKAQFCSVILPRLQQEQAETTRVCDEKVAAMNERQQTEQAQCDAQVAASRELVQNANATRKRRVDALLGRIRILKMQQLRAYAFQGWKDVYLRNVVAETTHAVMVARAAQALVSAPPRSLLRTDGSMAASTRQSPPNLVPTVSLPLRQLQLAGELFARGEEEDQWKRWRRVAPIDGRSASPSTTRRSSLASAASTASSTTSTSKAKSTVIPASSTSRRRASLM